MTGRVVRQCISKVQLVQAFAAGDAGGSKLVLYLLTLTVPRSSRTRPKKSGFGVPLDSERACVLVRLTFELLTEEKVPPDFKKIFAARVASGRTGFAGCNASAF